VDENGPVSNIKVSRTTWTQSLRRRLLAWFRGNARNLPWREVVDPYRVWVSEIMLQQTQVTTVIPYYQRFLAMFPTVAALASSGEAEVLRMWEGLGYYRRARQMHAAAQMIVDQHQGEFPRNIAAVRALPGIGRYTAGAILSIAFDQRQPIVEANTVRLYSRLLAYKQDPATSQGQTVLWEFAESLLPRKHVGMFNQALMELGSEICTPRQPACDKCPLATLCPTQAQGLQLLIPAMKKKPAVEALRQACVVVWHNDSVLLRRCGDRERWAGMWDFPRFDLLAQRGAALRTELSEKVADMTGIRIRPGARLTSIDHCVTRYRIHLACYEAAHEVGVIRGDRLAWVQLEQLQEYPLNVTARKICEVLSDA
jgi:A/G-specific adenine glycosylase